MSVVRQNLYDGASKVGAYSSANLCYSFHFLHHVFTKITTLPTSLFISPTHLSLVYADSLFVLAIHLVSSDTFD
jgi:hypothetical protein